MNVQVNILTLTFRVQLHVDDVAHDRRVVQVLDSILRRLDGSEYNFSNSEMLFILRIVQDVHLLNIAELLAHVGEESLSDVVVEFGERDLLRGHATDVTLIDLRKRKRCFETERLFEVTQKNVILRPSLFEWKHESLVYLKAER